ncbi:unnamed protein product [Caenorhabditis angaria]|uniref:F-box domain-containing protein n=1 Tax=Caenorhabditis angaria TaxID=860376 RepID=A0A9P1N0P6_9PELO|nr:unnamed protein product [Caenorhabditis angaria]
MGAGLSKYSGRIGWFDLPFDMRRSIIDLMDLKTRFQFAQCSIHCLKEVAESRNYIERIELNECGKGMERDINIIIISSNNEKWWFRIQYNVVFTWPKIVCLKPLVIWGQKDERVEEGELFENGDLNDVALKYFNGLVKKNTKSLKSVKILIDDFPYNQTNIKNLKFTNLRYLVLYENKHGIDPIMSGFVDFDMITRVEYNVKIPDLKLDDLFKMKSMNRKLINPIFSLEEFEDFLIQLLFVEEYDEQIKEIELDLKGIEKKMGKNNTHEYFIEIIRKYAEPRGLSMIINGEWKCQTGFIRPSKKWKHREHCIYFIEDCFKYFMISELVQ